MISDTANRVISGLLTNGATLVAYAPQDAVLRLADGTRVVVLDLESANSLPEATADAKAWVKKLRSGLAQGKAQLVGIGQSEVIAEAFAKAAPFLQFTSTWGFHQVSGPPYSTKRITGARFRELDKLVEKLAGIPPLPPESYEELVAANREIIEQEQRLSQALAAKFPWVTAALVVACVVMFSLGVLWTHGNDNLALLKMGANHGDRAKAGEVWRLLSSAFLHGGIEHLAVNMIALLSFGPLLERLLGARRYIFLYGLAALGGSLASAFLRSDPVLSVGASGAIWGLMAAGVGLALKPQNLLPPLALRSAKTRALIPLGINILYSLSPGIDLLAHLGGGIVGFALMFGGVLTRGVAPLWMETPANADPPLVATSSNSPGWTVLGWATALSFAGALVLALASGKAWTLADPLTFARVQISNTGVSMELPDALGKAVTEEGDGFRSHAFGRLDEQPSIVEVIISQLPVAVTAEEMAKTTEELRATLDNTPLPGATRSGPARIAQIGDKQVAIVNDMMNQVSIRTHLLAQEDKVIMIRQYSLPDLPATWSEIGERAVKTLAAN
jgi:rhomboid protease GluP